VGPRAILDMVVREYKKKLVRKSERKIPSEGLGIDRII
jgi:hypothetical protein